MVYRMFEYSEGTGFAHPLRTQIDLCPLRVHDPSRLVSKGIPALKDVMLCILVLWQVELSFADGASRKLCAA